MSLKNIYCQETAIETLQRAMSANRVAHSYIFAGMEGVGKFTTAKEFAKMMLCQNRAMNFDGFIDSCGECKSCKLFDSDSHPDFHHIYKELYWFTKKGEKRGGKAEIEAAQSAGDSEDIESDEEDDSSKKKKGKPKALVEIPVDVIREFFLDKVTLMPSMGRTAVYILSETEKVNKSSQNAMLKVLEEPPAHCIIILLCSRLEKLLPTIRSRCQIVRFGSIAEQVIMDKLMRQNVTQQQALFWARWTDGSIGRTIRWNKLDAYGFKKELVSKISGLELAIVSEISEWIISQAKDIVEKWIEDDTKQSKADIARLVQKAFIDMLGGIFADAIKFNLGKKEKLINFDQIDAIKKIASTNDNDKLALKIEKCIQTKLMIDSSVNEKLLWEQLLITVA